MDVGDGAGSGRGCEKVFRCMIKDSFSFFCLSCLCVFVLLCTPPSDSRSPDSSSQNPLPQGAPPHSPPGPPLPSSATQSLGGSGAPPPPPMPPPPLGSPFPVISSSMGSPGLPPPAPPGFSGPVSSPQVRGRDPHSTFPLSFPCFPCDPRFLCELPHDPLTSRPLTLAGLWSL